ncbi:MAG: methylenetetrahydrofolate--tRNA-(uracil(54)-C(5))-methyltransferase (FADH(2)-oxidizing) TrmFO [Fimbriimonadales bacterium]|nr:methylenetetrahydrofolate--tRNA-(uracil(54)-C(5))-methyltransferase (FADH(2)-oxidizing) TrmFO [Fimbriimonadales bacterium]
MSVSATVIGGGLAGSEAAWQLARRGFEVRLVEMRPARMTPAHRTGDLAELVCSNSFKSDLETTPAGLLKREMRLLGSLTLQVAETCRVPGGEALSVDRGLFASGVTEALANCGKVRIERTEANADRIEEWLADGPLIVATGPLTSDALADWLARATGSERLFFFDAVSPTVVAESIDRTVAFAGSRYGKGGDDYLNCPFSEDEYGAFVDALLAAERAPLHDFEQGIRYFEGCMPIEEIAERGRRSLAFGNFKPVGLIDPRTGRRPYAVLQLRPENADRTLYSLVACQTRLKWGEQKRVFRLVPGLQEAEFVRFGVIHRNTYLHAPKVLGPTLRLRSMPMVRCAGQLTGVEGYMESAATGLLAGLWTALELSGEHPTEPPAETTLGSLLAYLADPTDRDFAPMNANWGLYPPMEQAPRDKGQRRTALAHRAKVRFESWLRDLP